MQTTVRLVQERRMVYDPKIHHRRSYRLRSWEYSWPWWYYVTMCTKDRQCLFGKIVDGRVRLNGMGEIVREEWVKTPLVRPEVELDDFVIMPNHLHGIVVINNTVEQPDQSVVGTHGRASLLRRKPRSLGSFVAGIKSIVTKRINIFRGTPAVPVWQPRFYDHVIRNEADLHRIRTYIANNPLQWALDEETRNNSQLMTDNDDGVVG